MKKGRIVLLCSLWAMTLTLFVLASSGLSRREMPVTMTGEETDYAGVTESESPDDPAVRIIRIDECLSERTLAGILKERVEGYLTDVRVTAGKDILTLYGTLEAGDERLIGRFPALEPYRLVLRLAKGTEVCLSVRVVWNRETGFTVTPLSASLAGVDVDVKDLTPLTEEIKPLLTPEDGVTLTLWQLRPGGLYRCTEQRIAVSSEDKQTT